MKLTLSLLILSFFTASVYCQEYKQSTNLIVRFQSGFSKNTGNTYYIINADAGNPNAVLIYNLIPYKPERDAVNTGGVFFIPENDTTNAYYNYFATPTSAMEYLSHRGWHLVSVISEVTSDYTFPGSSNHPITTVSSRPVYYFKKDLQ